MKIATKATTKTTNLAGGKSYDMTTKEKLVSGVLTCLYNEAKFYGDNTKELQNLIQKELQHNPKFIAKLAVFTREKMNLRTFPTVIASMVALDAPDFTERVLPRVFKRPDQLLEMLAFFNLQDKSGNLAKRGRTIRGFKKLKRAITTILNSFDEYQLQKWDSATGITLANVLRIFHPKLEKPEIGKMILEHSLPVAYTWETELSSKGNTKEVWEKLIESKKLPYMAMLRNLRNIENAQVSSKHISMVCDFISNKTNVLKSKQFPYRFQSALKEITNRHLIIAVSNAMEHSVGNIEGLDGTTVIAVDLSGSMKAPVSQKSKVTRLEVACLTAAILYKKYPESIVVGFSNHAKAIGLNPSDSLGTMCKVISDSMNHGATNAHEVIDLIVQYSINPERVIFVTDMQFYVSGGNYGDSDFTALWNQHHNGSWLHLVDLCGYGYISTRTGKVNLTAGWSDSILQFLPSVELGEKNLIKSIEDMEL